MKRAVCVALGILILACSVPAFAKNDSVFFTVATDIHIENTASALEVNCPESELYFQASGSGNLYDQAATLTKQFLYSSAREGAEFILMPGDLTRNGNEEQHRYVAKLLSDFEDDTGIQVYVVPGNHDYFRSGRDEFREYYYRLGYDAALDEHGETSSYTADVADGYRLIAVDSNNPGEDGDGITASLLAWIKAQAETAKKDGKKIIYMMHHPLLEHLYMGKLLMKDFIIRNSFDFYRTNFGIVGDSGVVRRYDCSVVNFNRQRSRNGYGNASVIVRNCQFYGNGSSCFLTGKSGYAGNGK